MNLIETAANPLADAEAVNANFTEVSTAISGLDNRITILEGQTQPSSSRQVHIDDFGAEPGTVSTVAIQAAIDSLPSGGVVLIGPGTYLCGTVNLHSGITLQGEGGTVSILKLIDGGNVPVLKRATAATGIHLRHLGIDGNKANNPLVGHPVEFAGVTDSSITHCHIYNSRQNGIRWDGCTGNLIAFNQVYGNEFCGIRCGETGTSIHTRITGNYCLNNGLIGISVDSVLLFIITDNVCNNNVLWNGIDLCASEECVVNNNICVSNGSAGIALDGWTYPGSSVDNNVVNGNVCMYNGEYGFDTANANSQIVLTGNNLRANTLGPYRDNGVGPGKKLSNNRGLITEASGTVQIPQGVTYVDVAHGLSFNPEDRNVQATRSSLGGNSTKFWVSNVGNSTFRINVNIDPGPGGAWFNWKITRAS